MLSLLQVAQLTQALYRNINLLTYNAALSLQTRIPSQLGGCWRQEPVTLTDAHDRVWPIPLELIDSWEVCTSTRFESHCSGLTVSQALEAVLEVKFRQVPGHQKIKRREYTLRALHMSADIEHSVPFTSHFLPGRHVDMTMLFKGGPESSCPGCKLETVRAEADAECQIQW